MPKLFGINGIWPRYASCRSNDSDYRIYDESYETSCSIKIWQERKKRYDEENPKQLRGFFIP